MDYNGYTYASVNGTCIYKEKTTAKQQSRCSICDKGNYIGSSYFGAGDNILSLDTYHFKLALNIIIYTYFHMNV